MVNSQYVKPSCCLACFACANVMLDIVLLTPTLIIYCIQLSSLFRYSLILTGGTAHQIIGKTETEGVVWASLTAACVDGSMPRHARGLRGPIHHCLQF